jgi:hypothetical protein
MLLSDMLCFLLTLMLENANGRSSSSHLTVMNHVIIDGDLGVVHPSLPRPEQFIAAANSLENKEDRNILPGRTFICPDNCRCENDDTSAVCGDVTDLSQLLDQFSNSGLTSLTVSSCNEGTSWIDSNRNDTKVGLRTHPSLIHLSITACQLMEAGDVGLLLDRLGVPAQLKSLKISRSGLAQIDLGLLAQRVGSLESLILTDNNLAEILIRKDDGGAVENPQTHLRDLNLAGNDLTAFNLEQVVGQFPALERLNLSSNRLEEMSAALSGARQGRALRTLDLSRNSRLELVCNRVLHAVPNLGKKTYL